MGDRIGTPADRSYISAEQLCIIADRPYISADRFCTPAEGLCTITPNFG